MNSSCIGLIINQLIRRVRTIINPVVIEFPRSWHECHLVSCSRCCVVVVGNCIRGRISNVALIKELFRTKCE